MKRMLSMLLAVLALLSPASAAELSLTPIASATPLPAGIDFSCELFSLTLPFGFDLLPQDMRIGYEAAVESDYPGAAQTLLVAAGPNSASIYIGAAQLTQDPVEAAREAALGILGNADAASERICGANRCGSFACTAEDLTYEVCFLACPDALLTLVFCNMLPAEIDALIAGLLPAPVVSLP